MFVPLHDANPLRRIAVPWVNYSLIAVTCAAFLITGATDPALLQLSSMAFGLIPSVVTDIAELPPELVVIPETLTYVTYAFLHGDLWHLGGNMLFLWVFGDNIEDAMGHLRYALFYPLCAVGGGLLHVVMDPALEAPLIGASGAVAGVTAAYLILHPHVRLWILVLYRIPLRLSASWVLGAWIAFQVVNIVLPGEPTVAWWAHIGGIATGIALITFLRRPDVPLFDRPVAGRIR